MEVTSAGSCTISGANKSQQALPAKRKFFQWAVKWFYANMSEDPQEKPDAPVLACLLQSIGFQLREFEKIEETGSTDDDGDKETRNEGLTVTIECGTSGMRARLEMDDVKCQCPNSEDAKDASFWSVSGTGPAATVESTNKVEETGSNLLPPVSKETRRVIGEVMYRVLDMIGDKSCDVNQNERSHSNLNLSRVSSTRDVMDIANDAEATRNDSVNIVRSRTQPEFAVTGARSAALHRYNWAARPLARENTVDASSIPKNWGDRMDLECGSIDGDQPRPSPPKIASSPAVLHQLCSSLGQISLQSEEGAGNLAEHVIRAHRSLEKAVEILLGKRSPLSRNSPNLDDGTFLKPPEGGLHPTGSALRKSTGSSRVSPTYSSSSRPGSSCSMPTPTATSRASLSTSSSGRPGHSTQPAKSPAARRSFGSALTSRISTTPLSSTSGTNKRGALTNPSATKIPGRRKSFGALNAPSTKLSVPRNSGVVAGTRKKSTSPATIPPEERVIIVAKRRVSPDPKNVAAAATTSGLQRPGSAANSKPEDSENSQGGKMLPGKNTATGASKESAARKIREGSKFGFCNKKL